MSEFQEKLQVLKDSVSEYKNPALMSSDELLEEDKQQENEGDEQLLSEEISEQESESQPIQRNDKGHRRRKTLRDKHIQVLAENRAKDIQLQQSMAYIQEQERRLAELQAKADQSAHYSNIYYENSLENDEQRVISELEFAEESGDTKKKIELQKRLAEIAAQRQTLLLSKSLPKQQPQHYQEPYYQDNRQYSPAPQPVNENYEIFLEENPWADPNSEEFDQNLYNEANELVLDLNKRLKLNNASNIIGTADYFEVIKREMHNRYGINNNSSNDDYEEAEYAPRSHNNNIQHYEVAPVTKKGSSMADRYVSNRRSVNGNGRPRLALSTDEDEIARGVASVLSQLHKDKSGKQVSIEEARAIYYDAKVKKPWIR